MKRSRVLQLLGGVVLLLATIVMVAPAASGATPDPVRALVTCGGAGCSGLDPVVTGCNRDGALAAPTPVTAWGGRLNLWWSNTCQSNWLQYNDPNSAYCYTLELTGSGGFTDNFEWCGGTGWIYGNLVYSPGLAHFCVGRVPQSGGVVARQCWSQ